MLRTLSDGFTIVSIQGILVAPVQQQTGVGGARLEHLIASTGYSFASLSPGTIDGFTPRSEIGNEPVALVAAQRG